MLRKLIIVKKNARKSKLYTSRSFAMTAHNCESSYDCTQCATFQRSKVLIIFSLILQTIISAQMLSIRADGNVIVVSMLK